MSELIKLLLIITFVACCNAIQTEPRTDARIIGGVHASEDYAQHMVALLNIDRPVCGGSIVTKCHVFTAAHCLTPFEKRGKLVSTFYGRVGSLQWASGGTIVNFAKHYKHPQYNEEDIKNDIGILEVEKPFEWSETIGMIGLQFKRVEIANCFVTGWGRTGPKITDISINLSPTPANLQMLYVGTMPAEQCSADMQYAFENNPYILHIPHVCPEAEICAFHSHGHGMCHGDSGSALICDGLQVGIVSWGLPCAIGAPDVFVRTSGMKNFTKPILDKCDC